MQFNPDHDNQKCYLAALSADNYENELHHAINSARLEVDGTLNGCLYTDIDDTWTNPTLKLVFADTNYKNNAILS